MNDILHALSPFDQTPRDAVDGFQNFATDFFDCVLRCWYRIDEYGKKNTRPSRDEPDDSTPTEVTICRVELVKGADSIVQEIRMRFVDGETLNYYEKEIGERLDKQQD